MFSILQNVIQEPESVEILLNCYYDFPIFPNYNLYRNVIAFTDVPNVFVTACNCTRIHNYKQYFLRDNLNPKYVITM